MFKTPNGFLKRLPQLGFKPRTDHLHDDCSTVDLPSYLQRRITLPLIYFESGVSKHYQGRRDIRLISKHLSIEGPTKLPLSFCIVVRLDVYRPPGASLLPFLEDCPPCQTGPGSTGNCYPLCLEDISGSKYKK